MRVRTFEYDDWPRGDLKAWPCLNQLRESLPGFRATLFAIPAEMTDMHWAAIASSNNRHGEWLRVAPHGFIHQKGECRTPSIYGQADRMRMLHDIDRDPRWTRLYKAPWYGYDAGFVELLGGLGFAIAVRTLSGFPMPANSSVRIWCHDDRRLIDSEESRHAHPDGSIGNTLGEQLVQKIIGEARPDDTWGWPDEMTRSSCLKINLGCGPQSWKGWVGLDHKPEISGPGTIQWSVGDTIPFAACMADVVHQSHLAYYIAEADYVKHFLEVWRVLRPGGMIRLGEDETDVRVWRKAGTNHATGKIKSAPTQAKLRAALEQVGFTIKLMKPGKTECHHKDVLQGDNRNPRWRLGHKYYLEATKAIEISDLSRAWRADPRATRRGAYRLPESELV